MFVYKTGVHNWKIPNKKVEKLNNLIESFGFRTFNLSDDMIIAQVTCQPSCITTVKFADGTVKEIDHYLGIISLNDKPDDLTKFENAMERIVGAKKYATPKLHIYKVTAKDEQVFDKYIVVAASEQDAIDCAAADCNKQIEFESQKIGTAQEYYFEPEIIMKAISVKGLGILYEYNKKHGVYVTMNILCIGDVCGDAGCDFLREVLPGLKKLKGIDLVIANGENSAASNGITPQSAEHLLTSGVDIITGGNHSFRRREMYSLLEHSDRILRPANYPDSTPGGGFTIVDCGYALVAVINLLGVVYLESLNCPFETADRLIQRAKDEGADIIMVDFHAEATSEKRAMGFYLDSRVSAVFGTHTHVQTADEQILPRGTGYITDLGMTGPIQSVLGVSSDTIITKFKDKMPIRFDFAKGDCMLNGCIFCIDHKTGLTTEVERINIT